MCKNKNKNKKNSVFTSHVCLKPFYTERVCGCKSLKIRIIQNVSGSFKPDVELVSYRVVSTCSMNEPMCL